MSLIMEHLRCPICFEVPEAKVFQCKNGHTFCSQCSQRLKKCSQCRVVLGTERIRNRTLENILDATKFGCPNKEIGCTSVLSRGEISSHLQYCKFEPFYFCKLIGFQNCTYNAAKSLHGNSSELLAHFEKTHPELDQTVVESSDKLGVCLNYENFLCRANKLAKGTIAIWTPHLIKVKHSRSENQDVEDYERGDDGNDDDETVLLLLCQISESTRNAGWVCLCMTTDTKEQRQSLDVSRNSKTSNYLSTAIIQYQLRGQHGSEDNTVGKDLDNDDGNEPVLLTPKMSWNAPLLTFKAIDRDLENYALRIPICVLNSFNNGKGGLEVRLKINIARPPKDILKQHLYKRTNITEMASFVTNTNYNYSKPQCITQRMANAEEQNDEDLDQENQVVFSDVYCNGCGQRPLVNVRYKCLQCSDYDLCKECMDRGDTHMHHIFARIHSQRQNDLLNWKHHTRVIKGRLSYIWS